MIPNLTVHAHRRWGERFPYLNYEEEWRHALPVTRKMKRKISKSRKPDNTVMYLLSANGVVFVYAKTGVVITVLRIAYNGARVTQKGRAWWNSKAPTSNLISNRESYENRG